MKPTEARELAMAKAHGPNSRRVLDYSYTMKGILDFDLQMEMPASANQAHQWQLEEVGAKG